jgi:predicted ATPase
MGSSARRKFQISAAGSKAAGKATTLGALSKAGTAAYSIHKGI